MHKAYEVLSTKSKPPKYAYNAASSSSPATYTPLEGEQKDESMRKSCVRAPVCQPYPSTHKNLLPFSFYTIAHALDGYRCVVQRVDADTGRVVVTLDRSRVSASPAVFLRSLLSETFATSRHESAGGSAMPAWGRLEFGATTNAVVVALKEYGVVLKALAGKKGGGDEGGQLMVCPLEHAQEGVEEGNEVKVSKALWVKVGGAWGGFRWIVFVGAGPSV